MGRTLWNVVRLVMAIAVVLAIIVQSSAAALAQEGDWDPSRYYAYFSIQAYLIGAVVLFWAFRRRNAPPSRLLDLFRGASTAYLMVTFFVVLLFLSELTASLELPGVDLLLHKIFPVVVVIDWILFPARPGCATPMRCAGSSTPSPGSHSRSSEGRPMAGIRIHSWTSPAADTEPWRLVLRGCWWPSSSHRRSPSGSGTGGPP